MQEGGFFYQAFVYLSAAVIAVPVAKKLGLGSVLGFLLAGVIIGPFVFGFVGEEGQDVMHFAEFGVVMMLFLIGLELRPSLLWKLRIPILGIGGAQVMVTATAITFLTLAFTALSWQVALAIGLTLALSSTAIVLQTLNEKRLLKTKGGQSAFSVLLFQDIMVIPILAFLPLLATNTVNIDLSNHQPLWIESQHMLLRAGIILGVIISIIYAGKYLISPLFRLIALTHLRELFTAAALLLIIGITLLMSQVGLSPALGTFLAGVVLAQNEYRHELETDIEPFKGLLLGLFFIAVGASINFNIVIDSPSLIAMIVVGLIAVKLIILLIIGRVFKMHIRNNLLFTFSLAQGGEFAFVLLSYALQNGVITSDVANPLIVYVAISMSLTPILMLINEKLITPIFRRDEAPQKDDDEIDDFNHIIIAGFGRYGSTIGRFLQANGKLATYLDIDPNNVEFLRQMGYKVFYGDASRKDLLHAAGAADASLLIVAVDDSAKALEIVDIAQKHFPHLKIIARSKSQNDCYNLLDRKIDGVFREYTDSALRMAAEALYITGHRKYQVQRSLKKFRKHDEIFLKELFHIRHEEKAYFENSKQHLHDLEKMIHDDLVNEAKDKDLGWDAASIKEEFAPFVRQMKNK